MVNRLQGWDEVRQVGNPTRCAGINDLIKCDQKKELRKQGKASAAQRPLEQAEFEFTLGKLNEFPDTKRKYMVSAAAKFQFHMVA